MSLRKLNVFCLHYIVKSVASSCLIRFVRPNKTLCVYVCVCINNILLYLIIYMCLCVCVSIEVCILLNLSLVCTLQYSYWLQCLSQNFILFQKSLICWISQNFFVILVMQFHYSAEYFNLLFAFRYHPLHSACLRL